MPYSKAGTHVTSDRPLADDLAARMIEELGLKLPPADALAVVTPALATLAAALNDAEAAYSAARAGRTAARRAEGR